MLIAVFTNKENKISSCLEETKNLMIYDRKFEKVKFIENRFINDSGIKNLVYDISDCKFIISKYIIYGSDLFKKFSDLGIQIIKEDRTIDPLYAVRLM